MIGYFCESVQVNPYWNLALEEYLLSIGKPVLYLWQNENTVVIGRNQNAFAECDMNYVRDHEIAVVRRITGGGAVYHDLGNLNFSIILPKELYDISRSMKVVLMALHSLGIPVEANGRNDLLLFDKKISGSAYYSNDVIGLHHGTILFRADTEKISKVLTVPANKLLRHGVSSVQTRITDLAAFSHVTLDMIRKALREAFCREYELLNLEKVEVDDTAYSSLLERYLSREWNIDRINEYNISSHASFQWGSVTVSIRYKDGEEQRVEISSDSLEPDTIDEIRSVLNHQKKPAETHNIIMTDIIALYYSLSEKGEEYNGNGCKNASFRSE